MAKILTKHIRRRGPEGRGIRTKKEEVRYLFREHREGFTVWLDDPAALHTTGILKSEARSIIKKHQKKLDENIVVFELCKMALLLPAYMKFKKYGERQ